MSLEAKDYEECEALRAKQLKSGTRLTLKRTYPCKCAGCQQTVHVAPSLMMSEFGLNTGSGKCPKCQTFLHLEIDGNNATMLSERFDHFVERIDRGNELTAAQAASMLTNSME